MKEKQRYKKSRAIHFAGTEGHVWLAFFSLSISKPRDSNKKFLGKIIANARPFPFFKEALNSFFGLEV